MARLAPEDVFTPRSNEINQEMYISRELLEGNLKRALRGSLHIIMHGQSGTGKTWLYKKVLKEQGIPYVIANLANASRFGKISGELKNIIEREGAAKKVGYDETKKVDISILAASGGVEHKGTYEIGQLEPFEACLKFLNKKAGGKKSILVLDNLEAVFKEDFLKELADLIILCDDDRYAGYNVKLLIVGVPGDVREYFFKTPHLATVSNRLIEIPEVTRMKTAECDALVRRGFIDKLKYDVFNMTTIEVNTAWITDRIPQSVHEYCLELAYIGESTRTIKEDDMEAATFNWLMQSQTSNYSLVESHMNERDTKAGRRNQTLFALARCPAEQFKSSEVEEIIRRNFPFSTDKTKLNVPQMLSQLSKGDKPLIKRSPKGDAYTFTDPRIKLVLRAMLRKRDDEKVEKIQIR